MRRARCYANWARRTRSTRRERGAWCPGSGDSAPGENSAHDKRAAHAWMEAAEEPVRLARLDAIEPLDRHHLADPAELAVEERCAVGRLLVRCHVVLWGVEVRERERAALLGRRDG